MDSNHEKNGGRKSRDTLPLRGSKSCFLPIQLCLIFIHTWWGECRDCKGIGLVGLVLDIMRVEERGRGGGGGEREGRGGAEWIIYYKALL